MEQAETAEEPGVAMVEVGWPSSGVKSPFRSVAPSSVHETVATAQDRPGLLLIPFNRVSAFATWPRRYRKGDFNEQG